MVALKKVLVFVRLITYISTAMSMDHWPLPHALLSPSDNQCCDAGIYPCSGSSLNLSTPLSFQNAGGKAGILLRISALTRCSYEEGEGVGSGGLEEYYSASVLPICSQQAEGVPLSTSILLSSSHGRGGRGEGFSSEPLSFQAAV